MSSRICGLANTCPAKVKPRGCGSCGGRGYGGKENGVFERGGFEGYEGKKGVTAVEQLQGQGVLEGLAR